MLTRSLILPAVIAAAAIASDACAQTNIRAYAEVDAVSGEDVGSLELVQDESDIGTASVDPGIENFFDGSTFHGMASATIFGGSYRAVNISVFAFGQMGDGGGFPGHPVGVGGVAHADVADLLEIDNAEVAELPVLFAVFQPVITGRIQGIGGDFHYAISVGTQNADGFIDQVGKYTIVKRTLVNLLSLHPDFGGGIPMNMSMDAHVGLQAPYNAIGDSGLVDFSHTAWMPAIEIVDENGDYWPGSTELRLVGESGVEYPLWRPGLSAEGDFDEDGDVDGNDLSLWRAFAGMTEDAGHVNGDADHDRDVDGGDFLMWQQQFGAAAATVTAADAVPEPGAAALGAAAWAWLAGVRVRRRLIA